MRKLLTLAASLLLTAIPTYAAHWLTDLTTARELATQQNKAILVNFTGSDWCGYCIQLKRDVFSKPEFDSYISDKFILLEVDITRAPQAKEIRAAREEICRAYDVRSFPTCLVLSKEGEVWGGFSGSRSTVSEVALILDKALACGSKLAEARKEEGLQRAKALHDVYLNYPSNFRKAKTGLEKEIEQLDPQDALGLRSTLRAEKQMDDLMREVRANHRNFKKQTEIFERYLAEALPGNRERIMERKRSVVVFPCLNIMLLNASSPEDIEKAREYIMKEAAISYPESIRDEMIRSLETTFADPAALLKKAQDIKARRR